MKARIEIPLATPTLPIRVDSYLRQITGRSREYIQSQIEQGCITLNGIGLSKSSQKLNAGDVVEYEFIAKPTYDLEPIPAELCVLYEDEAVLAINKPQDMVVHPAPSFNGPTLVHHLLHYLKHDSTFTQSDALRPGIVHRLDRGTSGVIVIAKTDLALESIAKQFKDRTVKKTYEALVWGEINPSGTIDSPIGRHPTQRQKMSSQSNKTREAKTSWEVVKRLGPLSLVRVRPHTGRTHQIRVHLSEKGFPIVGDPTYGRAPRHSMLRSLPPEPLALIEASEDTFLHAASLEIDHPITHQRLRFDATRPLNFQTLIHSLESDA